MPSVYWLYPWWTRNHRNGLKISTNVKYKLVSVICFPLTCFSLVSCRSFSYQPTWPNPIEFRFILLLLTYQSMTWTDYLSDKKKKFLMYSERKWRVNIYSLRCGVELLLWSCSLHLGDCSVVIFQFNVYITVLALYSLLYDLCEWYLLIGQMNKST